jgi:hypothetical protein
MNVSSVNFSQMIQMSSTQTSSSGLSSSQLALIEETLAQYDAESLSAEDAKEIVEIFSEAGITPSAALESAMSASGFDAREVGDLAGVGKGGGKGPMGPPPPPPEEEISSIGELLETLLAAEEDAGEEDTTITDATSFESIMDYTNMIVRLKDDAKSEVMDILNNYDAETNDRTQQETQAYIVNSLRQIFSDADNFNHFSFYA